MDYGARRNGHRARRVKNSVSVSSVSARGASSVFVDSLAISWRDSGLSNDARVLSTSKEKRFVTETETKRRRKSPSDLRHCY